MRRKVKQNRTAEMAFSTHRYSTYPDAVAVGKRLVVRPEVSAARAQGE